MINTYLNKKDELLPSLVIFSALQPYIGIPSIFPTDIQPLCLVLCIFYFFKRKKVALEPLNKSISLLFALFAVIATFLCLFTSEPANYYEIIRRLLPLFAASLYFATFSNILNLENKATIFKKAILYFILLWFVGIILNLFTGSTITSIFVNRNLFEKGGYDTERLVSFFSEPSRIPEQCYFSFLALYSIKSSFKKINFLILSAILTFVSLTSGAGQLIFVIFSLLPFLSLNLLGFIFNFLFEKLNYLKFTVGVAFTTLLIFGFNLIKESRGGLFVQNIINMGPSASIFIDEGIKVKISGIMLVIARLLVPEVLFSSPIDPWYVLNNEPLLYSKYIDVCRFFTSGDSCPMTYSVYSSLGSYIVYFGYLGGFFVLILYFLGLNKIIYLRDMGFYEKTIILSLFFSFILISLVKIPLANPGIFLGLSIFLNFKNENLKINSKNSSSLHQSF